MSQPMVCKTCGTIQAGKRSGSDWIELILWLCGLVPGIVYLLWRRFLKSTAYAACGSPALIDGNSPIGRMLVRNQHLKLP